MRPDDPVDHGSTPPTDPDDPTADPEEQAEDRRPPERVTDPGPADWRTSTYSRTEHPVRGHPAPERTSESSHPDTPEGASTEESPSVRGRHLAWARLEAAPDEPLTARSPTHRSQPTPPADTRPIGPPSPPEVHPTPPPPPRTEEPARPSPPPAAHPPPTTERAPADRGRPTDQPGVPSTLGRLVAIVITCGLAWALAVAVGIWLFVFLVSRST